MRAGTASVGERELRARKEVLSAFFFFEHVTAAGSVSMV